MLVNAPLMAAVQLILTALTLEMPGNSPNPRAVEEVRAGTRHVANAAWWGFNEQDSTESLQAAINSGAKQVTVPNMTRDWIVRPIKLVGDQELVLEPGVLVTAKRGEYRGKGDSLFTARDVSNLTIRGYGATVHMQKEDYIVGTLLEEPLSKRWFGKYDKAEWRMTLSLQACSNVKLYGLTLRDSGGDGIVLTGGRDLRPCEDIHIKDVVCDNNYRQGISVINVDGLLVENSVFKNTWGTPPSSGVDIEPDSPKERVRDVVFRNCSFEDNYGDGIEVYPLNLSTDSGDVSILFDNCRVTSRRGSGIRVSKITDQGPGGLIEFRNCVVENTVGYGIKVQDKSADRARVRFVNCTVRNAARDRNFMGAWAPIWFHLFKSSVTLRLGGVDFVDCTVEDDQDRPVIVVEETESAFGIFDITGAITIRNPHGVRTVLGDKQNGVTLNVRRAD